MREYRDKTVQEVFACICDRCHKRMELDVQDSGWPERLSLSFRGGFGSIFGDGNEVSVDLCPHCVRETLGAWLRVTSPDDEREAARRLARLGGSQPGLKAAPRRRPRS
jgi:hypothetical protein